MRLKSSKDAMTTPCGMSVDHYPQRRRLKYGVQGRFLTQRQQRSAGHSQSLYPKDTIFIYETIITYNPNHSTILSSLALFGDQGFKSSKCNQTQFFQKWP